MYVCVWVRVSGDPVSMNESYREIETEYQFTSPSANLWIVYSLC